MTDSAKLFPEGSKVVISPDEMRAWVMLPPANKGAPYTVDAVADWVAQNGVVHGVKREMIRDALDSGKTYELLEVARGDVPVDATAGEVKLCIEKTSFTGLRANSDGSLIYDDLSFLVEVPEGTVLADVVPAQPGKPGRSVTGQEVPPKEAPETQGLEGSGFELSADGLHYIAPKRSHISFVGEALVVTPLRREESWTPDDGKLEFEGNIVIDEDLHAGCSVEAGGSVYVAGRAAASEIKAGRNVLLCKGMRAGQGFASIEAGEYVWGQIFESATIKAGRDVCSTQLQGCEVHADGRVLVLGGRGQIAATTLYAKEGVVCATLGGEDGAPTDVAVGMGPELMERFESVERRLVKTTQEVQSLTQGMKTYEQINRNKPGKGKNTPEYTEMAKKRDNLLSVLRLLDAERTRTKRTMDGFSANSIIARSRVYPGVTVRIDTRVREIERRLERTKFKRDGEDIDAIEAGS